MYLFEDRSWNAEMLEMDWQIAGWLLGRAGSIDDAPL